MALANPGIIAARRRARPGHFRRTPWLDDAITVADIDARRRPLGCCASWRPEGPACLSASLSSRERWSRLVRGGSANETGAASRGVVRSCLSFVPANLRWEPLIGVDGAIELAAERKSTGRRRNGSRSPTALDRRGGVDPNDPLLTKDQAALLLNVAVRFIDRCVVERRIRYVKFGRYIRIPQSAIDEYVAASTVAAMPASPTSRPRFRTATAR
jgi:excisionase family DNA binding protein